MKSALVFAFATFAAGLGLAPVASAQRAADVPEGLDLHECTSEFEGFVIRHAVGSRPNQIVYVYLCDGDEWVLIDIER